MSTLGGGSNDLSAGFIYSEGRWNYRRWGSHGRACGGGSYREIRQGSAPPVCDTVVGLDVMPPTALALSESSYSITNKNRPQGAFRGRYDLTGGVAWCASPCATPFYSTSGLVLFSDPAHSGSYRIEHGADVPMGLTLLAEDARLCAALCGTLVLTNSSEEVSL